MSSTLESNASPSSDLELHTPDVGAQEAFRQALVTVATLQKVASSNVSAMIPGAWSPRPASAERP